ncbi:MAG: ABC transporter substrate-binding protein, partial [Gammaproteobacteria bacterium]|nr:ABC transporter substrate-binding protein [Gammaproteobacteria bacterium]
MKKFIYSIVGIALSGGFAMADDVKIGILMGFTGPIESLAPDIAAGGELAIREVSDSGMLLGGHSVVAVRGDSTCVDAAAATAAAERLVTSDGVAAINGANCSGVTTAVLNNVVLPNGIVMISPSATTPALSTAEDNGLFFRTAPSDARQGQVMANILGSRGITSVAVTYTNNDYGKGLADSFQSAYSGAGGEITTSVSHEDGKADYSAAVETLASEGGEVLVVI